MSAGLKTLRPAARCESIILQVLWEKCAEPQTEGGGGGGRDWMWEVVVVVVVGFRCFLSEVVPTVGMKVLKW